MVCPALSTFESINEIQPNVAAGSGATQSVKAGEHLEKRDISCLDGKATVGTKHYQFCWGHQLVAQSWTQHVLPLTCMMEQWGKKD